MKLEESKSKYCVCQCMDSAIFLLVPKRDNRVNHHNAFVNYHRLITDKSSFINNNCHMMIHCLCCSLENTPFIQKFAKF